MVELLHVILETICVLMSIYFFCQILLNMIFSKFLIPKVKPVAIGIFYRPPNANDFLNTFSNNIQQPDKNNNKIYLLRDFNNDLF